VRWLAGLLSEVPRAPRVRPADQLYWMDERPPWALTLGMGAQHALLALMLSLYAVIAARSLGMTGGAAAGYATDCIFLLGVNAVLQGLRNRLCPGLLVIAIPDPIALVAYGGSVAAYGFGAAAVGLLIAHGLIILLAGFLPRLRPFLPPEITGVVVLMLGVSLVTGGVSQSLGLDREASLAFGHVETALVTLAAVVGLSVWGGPRLRMGAVVLGCLAGTGVAVGTGNVDVDAVDAVAGLPSFGLPLVGRGLPDFRFVPAAVLTLILTELLGAMDQLGTALTLDKLTNARWRRPDMTLVSRSVRANSLANLLNGLFGLLPMGSSTAHIGLAQASGITARRVAIAAGLLLMVAAAFPPLTGVIVLTPEPVIGGLLVYTAAFMIANGMELILSQMMNARRTFAVGIALVAGLAVMLLPQTFADGPEWAGPIVASGLAVAALVAVGLNALFRIGAVRHTRASLPLESAAAAAADLLQAHGRAQGAARQVVGRASLALGQAIEALNDSGRLSGETIGLDIGSDGESLSCLLTYEGAPLHFGGREEQAERWSRVSGEALEKALAELPTRLIGGLADSVGSGRKGGSAYLRLTFDH